MRDAIQIRVVEKIWNDSYVAMVDGSPEVYGWRKLAKATAGTQFSMGRGIWARPAIRFYATYAKWNDAAARAGTVTCTGRDCGTPVDAYRDKRSGVSYGMQLEGWF